MFHRGGRRPNMRPPHRREGPLIPSLRDKSDNRRKVGIRIVRQGARWHSAEMAIEGEQLVDLPGLIGTTYASENQDPKENGTKLAVCFRRTGTHYEMVLANGYVKDDPDRIPPPRRGDVLRTPKRHACNAGANCHVSHIQPHYGVIMGKKYHHW